MNTHAPLTDAEKDMYLFLFSDPTRRIIYEELATNPYKFSVTELAERIQQRSEKPIKKSLQHHLRQMLEANAFLMVKKGTNVYYAINPMTAGRMADAFDSMRELVTIIAKRRQAHQDHGYTA